MSKKKVYLIELDGRVLAAVGPEQAMFEALVRKARDLALAAAGGEAEPEDAYDAAIDAFGESLKGAGYELEGEVVATVQIYAGIVKRYGGGLDAEEALDDGAIMELLQQLSDAQSEFEKLAYQKTSTMRCIECGGRGEVSAGSLGTMPCDGCGGAGVTAAPGAEAYDMPDFAALRRALVDEGGSLLGDPDFQGSGETPAIAVGRVRRELRELEARARKEVTALRAADESSAKRLDAGDQEALDAAEEEWEGEG